MKFRKRMILPVVLCWIVYAVISCGGPVRVSDSSFGGQMDVVLTPGLKSDVWLSPKRTTRGVPTIFLHENIGPPFALRLQIWDSDANYRGIELAEIIAEYSDGSIERTAGPMKWAFSSYFTGFMLSTDVEQVATRHEDLTIRLRGHLLRPDNTPVPFDVTSDFKAKSSSLLTSQFLYYCNE